MHFLLSLFVFIVGGKVQSVHQSAKVKRERQRMKDELGW